MIAVKNRISIRAAAAPAAVAAVLFFAAFARGAHDLWSATVVHLAVLALAAGGVAAACRAGAPIRLPALAGAAALLIAWTGAAVTAGNRFDAIFAGKDLAAAVLMFYIGANLFRSDRSVSIVDLAAVPALVIQSVVVWRQLLAPGGAAFAGEAPGTLINANVQAAFVLFWVPPLAFRWRADRGRRVAWYWALGLAGAAAVLLATASTEAALCLVVPALLWRAVTATSRGARAALIAGAALLVAGAAWYKLTRTYPWSAPWLPPRAGSDRLDWWRTGLRMFAEHPWVGIGPGGFPTAFAAFKVGVGQSTRFAHSLPVTILAEVGLAGALAVAAFATLWMRAVYAAGSFARLPHLAGAALFALFACVGLGGEYLVNQLALALFLGLCVAEAPAIEWRPRLPAAILAVGLAILVTPALVSPFLSGRFLVAGREALVAGDPGAAERRFASATELDPTSWDAWQGRSAALWALGRADEAIEAIHTASRLNRYDASLIVRKAKMLAAAGREAEALKEAERAYLLNPRLFN